MRGRGKKKAVSLILAVCFLLAGCGNTKIVLTTGLASEKYPAGFRRRWSI